MAQNTDCKGDISLGTGCRKCEKCLKQIEESKLSYDEQVKNHIEEMNKAGIKVEEDSPLNQFMFSMSNILGFERFLEVQEELEESFYEMRNKYKNKSNTEKKNKTQIQEYVELKNIMDQRKVDANEAENDFLIFKISIPINDLIEYYENELQTTESSYSKYLLNKLKEQQEAGNKFFDPCFSK